jgi:hypothetical protein
MMKILKTWWERYLEYAITHPSALMDPYLLQIYLSCKYPVGKQKKNVD